MKPPEKVAHKNFLAQWIALSLVLTCLGTMIALNISIEYKRTEVREFNRLKTQTDVVAKSIERQLAGVNLALENILRLTADWRETTDPLMPANQIKIVTGMLPGAVNINVIDANGAVLFSSLPDQTGQPSRPQDRFLVIKQNPDAKTLYLSPSLEDSNSQNIMHAARAMVTPNGQFAGMITATMEAAYFKTLMTSSRYAPDMRSALMYSDGTLFVMVPRQVELHDLSRMAPHGSPYPNGVGRQWLKQLLGSLDSTRPLRLTAQSLIESDSIKMDRTLVVTSSRDFAAAFELWKHDALIQAGLYGLILVFSIFGLYAYQRGLRFFERETAFNYAMTDRLRLALDQIPTFIFMKDCQHRYVYANRPTLALLNCSLDELRGSDDARFFPPATVARLKEIDARVLENGVKTAEEIVCADENGHGKRIYWEVKIPIYDDIDKSKIWGLCGVSTDITEQRAQQAALLESERRFRSTFDSAAIGIALVSLEGRFLQVNNSLCTIVGYSQMELQEKTFQDITHPDDLSADLLLKQELLDHKRDSFQMEKRYFHKDGHPVWILLSVAILRDLANKPLYFIVQIQDISERRSLLDKLEYQAHRDYLTGLHNRRFFLEQGESELARAQRYQKPLCLLMLDIDHFKKINDTHGHKAGDVVLQKLSSILQETLRTADVVGRIGGEEFAILLPETELNEAVEAAERLRKIVAASPVILEAGLPVLFTVSIGIARLKNKDVNLDILLNQADLALYQAKQTGRNKVCVKD
jgi:diguanylate cyclase (GGDEF)-like protein/PAS domain S-box-containing protein